MDKIIIGEMGKQFCQPIVINLRQSACNVNYYYQYFLFMNFLCKWQKEKNDKKLKMSKNI